MAGSFGYHAETIDVSLAMGELSLLPAVRKARADAIIVADGTSCRHQITTAPAATLACRARAGDELLAWFSVKGLARSSPACGGGLGRGIRKLRLPPP